MENFLVGLFGLVFGMVLGLFLLCLGWVIAAGLLMLGWHLFAVPVLGATMITFWQAFGAVLMAHTLFSKEVVRIKKD